MAQEQDREGQSGTALRAIRTQLGSALAGAVRGRASLLVIGGLIAAFVLTFVIAPFLSLLAAAFAGAGIQVVLTKLKRPSGASVSKSRSSSMGASKQSRAGGDLLGLFAPLAALVILGLGAPLALAEHDFVTAAITIAAFGGLYALLVRA